VPKTYDDLVRDSSLSRAEARLLLAHVVQKDKTWLIAHGAEDASEDQCKRVLELYAKRRNGSPVAYLLGWKEFYGHRFAVGPQVLIPRPETELLVEWGVEVLGNKSLGPADLSALDLGCGSGCIGISLALEARRLGMPLLEITLADFSTDALAYTERNAAALGLLDTSAIRVSFKQGSWLGAIDPASRFDVIMSNPPYIRLGDPHLIQGDLRFEPEQALSSGPSGLQALTEIIATAGAFLKPEGRLLLEHGYDQAETVQALLRKHGYVDIETRRDLAAIPRATAGRKPLA
jgi:release factor glutamine methyltransferase